MASVWRESCKLLYDVVHHRLTLYKGGKTVCALSLISSIGRKTLVVVHKEFLMNQWQERITQFLPNARVGCIRQSKTDVDRKDIVLGMLHSLSMRDYIDSILGEFEHVIFDECHHIATRVFSQVMYRVKNARYLLGLSATPKRRDGLSYVLHWFLGDIVYLAERPNEDNEMRAKVKRLVIVGTADNDLADDDDAGGYEDEEEEEPEYGYDQEAEVEEEQEESRQRKQKNVKKRPTSNHRKAGGNDILNLAGSVTALTNHTARNQVICEQIIQCLEEGRKILLLSDRIKHLHVLKKHLESLAKDRKIGDARKGHVSVGYYIGGMKQDKLALSAAKQVLLGTYAMSSEGLDIPSLDTIILATPRSSIEQSIGRIMRGQGSSADATSTKKHPLIIDIVDNDDSFRGSNKNRMRFYRASNFEMEVSYYSLEGETDRAAPYAPSAFKDEEAEEAGDDTASIRKLIRAQVHQDAEKESALQAQAVQGRGRGRRQGRESGGSSKYSAALSANHRYGLSMATTMTTTTTTTTTKCTAGTTTRVASDCEEDDEDDTTTTLDDDTLIPPLSSLNTATTKTKAPTTTTATTSPQQQKSPRLLTQFAFNPANMPPAAPRLSPTSSRVTSTSPTQQQRTIGKRKDSNNNISIASPFEPNTSTPDNNNNNNNDNARNAKRQKQQQQQQQRPAPLPLTVTPSLSPPRSAAVAINRPSHAAATSAAIRRCSDCGKPYSAYFTHTCELE
eukprot:TRINITY_DN3528_c0_g1_i4.p1 TRINITY_DN3528_c0_g1~~TRINITY_DN3528_c0_g1_i4.p1  ORF type:complete len:732 (-),score=179.31 TRINITY_DN3528_c0_g1_i4:8-2203(-)